MTDAINWFEIPVRDLERSVKFYEAVLGRTLRRETFSGMSMAIFTTADPKDVGGALVLDPKREPSANGALVFLDAPDLDACVLRAAKNGGMIQMPKTDIGDPGFIAVIKDPDGNVVGLHAHRA